MIIYNLAGKKVAVIIGGRQEEILAGVDIVVRIQISYAYPVPARECQEEFTRFVLKCVEEALKLGVRIKDILEF